MKELGFRFAGDVGPFNFMRTMFQRSQRGVALADHVTFAEDVLTAIDRTGGGQARTARYRAIYDRLRYAESLAIVFDPVTGFYSECQFLSVLGLIDTIANHQQGQDARDLSEIEP
jgi:hypothetical protein